MFLQPAGWALITGLALLVLGIVLCSIAGKIRERDQNAAAGLAPANAAHSVKPRKTFLTGLVLCVLAGLLSPAVNYAFAFGDEIRAAALKAGATPASASNAIWAIVFTANYLVNVLFCVYLIIRRRNVREMAANSKPKYWAWALFTGLTWPLGIVLYGIGAGRLGEFGAYAGFSMMLTFSILASNFVGAIIGEWKGASALARNRMVMGVAVLVLAALVFGYANTLMNAKA